MAGPPVSRSPSPAWEPSAAPSARSWPASSPPSRPPASSGCSPSASSARPSSTPPAAPSGRPSSTGPRAGCATTCSTPRCTSRCAALSEQAVGEVLDRVDDDTHEVGSLVRRQVWDAMRTVFSTLPMWIVAGPDVVAGVDPLPRRRRRRLLARSGRCCRTIAERKVAEEIAWTDHAAALEEGVAARDDLRTSLGQAYVVRRCAELSAVVQRGSARSSPSSAGSRGAPGCSSRPARRASVVAGSRWSSPTAVGRPARHAVPRHEHLRRPGRPDRPPPARAAGRAWVR